MARRCTICASPRRDEIDEALTRGEPNRRIAARCAVSDTSLRRHAAEHLPRALVLAKGAEEETRGDSLLGLLRECVADARRLRTKAEHEKDYRCAIAAVKVLADIVEKLADVAERLAKSGAEEPRTLSEFIAKIAKKREGELAALARGDQAAPVKVEWVNDWRGPVAPPGGPAVET